MQRPLTNNVGAGLLANRVYQLMHLWLTHRIRDGLTAGAYPSDAPQSKCGSWLVGSPHRCEDGLTANWDVGLDRVHIRYVGNGHLGFRPDGGSLLKSAKVSK
ncbi:hypothetical protein, partial [Pseudomonas carnis]